MTDDAPFFEDLVAELATMRRVQPRSTAVPMLLFFIARILLGMWADQRVFRGGRRNPDQEAGFP